jgi:hypothetical protein
MKKISFITSFLLVSAIVFAQQNYIPMLKKENTWIMNYSFFMDSYQINVKVDKDTTIAGKTYKIVRNELLREDSSAAKVYIYNRTKQIEGVLYDFNIKVGDVMDYSGFKSVGSVCKYKLTGIESFAFDNGVKTKMYKFNNMTWIMGMGSFNGVTIEPAFGCQSDPSYNVSCFLQKSRKLYGDNNYGFCKALNDNELATKNSIDAYLNTTDNSTLYVQLHQDISDCTLRIYDILGNAVLQKADLENYSTISLDALAKGIYILHFYEGDKLIGVKKVSR